MLKDQNKITGDIFKTKTNQAFKTLINNSEQSCKWRNTAVSFLTGLPVSQSALPTFTINFRRKFWKASEDGEICKHKNSQMGVFRGRFGFLFLKDHPVNIYYYCCLLSLQVLQPYVFRVLSCFHKGNRLTNQ